MCGRRHNSRVTGKQEVIPPWGVIWPVRKGLLFGPRFRPGWNGVKLPKAFRAGLSARETAELLDFLAWDSSGELKPDGSQIVQLGEPHVLVLQPEILPPTRRKRCFVLNQLSGFEKRLLGGGLRQTVDAFLALRLVDTPYLSGCPDPGLLMPAPTGDLPQTIGRI